MGTHPIFESDFDCLTVQTETGLQWLTRSARRKLSASEPKSFTVIKLTASFVSTNYGESQSVSTRASVADSRVNTSCHQLVMAPRPAIVIDARIRKTSRSSL